MDAAEGRAGKGHLRLGDRPRDPEVHDLHPPIAADQHVAGLDVAMDDAARMGGLQRAGDRGRDAGGLRGRQRPVASQDRREVLAVHVFHDDVRPRGVLAVVVDGDDVRVAQRGRVLGLLAEPRPEVGIAQVLGTQQLDGDLATELGVERAKDGGHPALTEQLDQPIALTQGRPDLRQTWPLAISSGAARNLGRAPRGIVPHGGRTARPGPTRSTVSRR